MMDVTYKWTCDFCGSVCTVKNCNKLPDELPTTLQPPVGWAYTKEGEYRCPFHTVNKFYTTNADLIDTLNGIAYNTDAKARIRGYEEAIRYIVAELQTLVDQLKADSTIGSSLPHETESHENAPPKPEGSDGAGTQTLYRQP